MSLYSKKLHIKKPNGVVQTANLYTDKNDVGNNYLTFRDSSNTVFSILDVNGDIDCKISKNNINYKIRKENTVNVIPTSKSLRTPFNFTVPNGVTVLRVSNDSSIEGKWSRYIKVVPNRTYNFSYFYNFEPTDETNVIDTQGIQIMDSITGKILTIMLFQNDSRPDSLNPSRIFCEFRYNLYPNFNINSPVYLEYSNEINKSPIIHADLT